MGYISASYSKNKEILVWERNEAGNRITKKYDSPYYFYIKDKNGDYKDIYGNALSKLSFNNYNEFKEYKDTYKRENIKLYESDINPIYKVLSEHYYDKKINQLNCTYLDIEVDYKNYSADDNIEIKVRSKGNNEFTITVRELRKLIHKISFQVYDEAKSEWIDAKYSKYVYDGEIGFPVPETCYAKVSAISLYHAWKDKMVLLVLLPDNNKWTIDDIPQDCHDIAEVVVCNNEEELLRKFYREISDSDILSGWNSEGFDIPYMYYRTKKILGENWANKLSFNEALPPKEKEVEVYVGSIQKRIEIYGRTHIDYLELFKKLETTTRRSFTLDAISEEILPEEKKLEFDCSLYDLYYERFPDFCRYNIRDTIVLKGFEKKLGYMGVAIATYHSTTVLLQDVLGTVKVVESAIINKCHYFYDTKVPDTKEPTLSSGKFAGALVTFPKVGMHNWSISIDFNSLYPSLIRKLNISPEKIIGQFHTDYESFEEISKQSEKLLTLIKDDGTSETHSAKIWSSILLERNHAISAYGTVFDQNEQGFLPQILEEWYDERVSYKNNASSAKDKMQNYSKDSKEYNELKIEYEYYHKLQFIKKILLNSTYGACGNKFFRFYDLRMAESTTRSGREALMEMNRIVATELDKKVYPWESAQNLALDYSFPSKSIIYNDTDSSYIDLYEYGYNTLEKVVKYATELVDIVNDKIEQFTKNYFFTTNKFANILKGALDVISDKSIFIKKKYYVMHLLYDEGKPKEKMKVMGVQIKKTTIPKAISNKLTKYVEDLLKGKEWLTIAKEIVAYKDTLLKEVPIIDIGLPKGIKNVEKYTNDYNMEIPNLRIPGHVAAALFYNKCLELYKDVASPKIVSGMKIKTYYLKRKFGYFKSIALPTDLQILPDWFRENFMHLIDKEAQIDRLVDKPLDSILNAIDKVSPSKKTITIEEIFEF